MKAYTLEDALNNFQVNTPLLFTQEAKTKLASSPEFYVDRPNNPRDEIKTLLLRSKIYDKILYHWT
jgi:hypothetical protein